MEVDLSSYNNEDYSPGAGLLRRVIWYMINAVIFHSWLVPYSALKVHLLRLFGATVGRGVIIKPRVNIKYPWFLNVGDNVWIGENVWIDNLTNVALGNNACISQGACLITGNHDYKDRNFGLIVKSIIIDSGCWIGARSTVCPGVVMATHSILAVGSVLTTDTEAYVIYQGIPATKIRMREIIK